MGKSTWINSFANYLNFETLEEAVDKNKIQPVVAIPSKFIMNGQEIMVGTEDVNENHFVEYIIHYVITMITSGFDCLFVIDVIIFVETYLTFQTQSLKLFEMTSYLEDAFRCSVIAVLC